MVEIIARDAAFRAGFELFLPPIEGPRVELNDFVRFLASSFEAAVVDQLRQWHADLVGDDLDRFRKADALDLHDEVEDRSAFVTAETVEDLFGRTDGERRRLFLVKRATRHPVCALFLELHVILNDADDVSLSFEIVDESLGVTHWANGRRYCLNSTSVAPVPP